MNIAISGATGFIGKHLTRYLTEVGGHRIVSLGRNVFLKENFEELVALLEGCDVIINLAGAPINKRWTSSYKKELYDSRIGVTHSIVKAVDRLKNKPRVFISTSAVGFYPSEGKCNEYSSQRGTGFLSDLCDAWELEALQCDASVRLVIARFGVVLSPDGGALKEMLKVLHLTKTAVTIGPGTQPFPWIDLVDLCRIMNLFITNEDMSGNYNLVAPEPTTQRSFTRALAHAYKAWLTVLAPSVFFVLLMGEAASFVVKGQNVQPTRLLSMGFRFESPTLEKFFSPIDNSTVPTLDLKRYMGVWYEIARYDHSFERGLTHVTAEYSIQSDQPIRVVNRGRKKTEKGFTWNKAVGKAKIPDPTQPGKLKVAFFLWFYSDYYVLELDQKEYSYALIGSKSDKYLWILSRTPQISEEVRTKLLTAAKLRGYDTGRLLWVDQGQ